MRGELVYTCVLIFKHSLCWIRCSHRVVSIKKQGGNYTSKTSIFQKLPSVIFFWTYSTSGNNKMFKIHLAGNCWDAIWEHCCHFHSKNWKSWQKHPNLWLLFFTLLKYFKCSLGSGYSFSPTYHICIRTAKCLLGNGASRAEPEGRPAARHSVLEEECCICLVGMLVSWRKLGGISISTVLLGNSWAPSKHILFCWV